MEKTLLEYWYILYSRKWLIVLITASSILTAVILSEVIPPVYEAKAVFFVPQKPDSTNFFSPSGGTIAREPLSPLTQEEPHGPYFGILQSMTIAELVQKDFPQKTISNLMRRDVDVVLSEEFMIEVYVRDGDPHVAAGVANAYVKYFNQLMSGYSMPSTYKTATVIKKEISSNKKKLERATRRLKDFQERHKIANLDEQTRQLIAWRKELDSKLEDAQIEYERTSNKILATENEFKKEVATLTSSEIVVTSPLLLKLNDQLAEIETKLGSLKVELKETHPNIAALNKSYDTVQKNINKEVDRILNSQIKTPDTFSENLRRQLVNLYVDKETERASTKAIKNVLDRIETSFEKMPGIMSQLDILTMEVERYKKLLETLNLNLAESDAQMLRTLQVAVIVEEAKPPIKPSFPILWLNSLVAFLAGFIGSVFYCFFVQYLEETREKRVLRLLKAIKASEGEGV